ncbi:unnamed protein product [Prunus brigantina]
MQETVLGQDKAKRKADVKSSKDEAATSRAMDVSPLRKNTKVLSAVISSSLKKVSYVGKTEVGVALSSFARIKHLVRMRIKLGRLLIYLTIEIHLPSHEQSNMKPICSSACVKLVDHIHQVGDLGIFSSLSLDKQKEAVVCLPHLLLSLSYEKLLAKFNAYHKVAELSKFKVVIEAYKLGNLDCKSGPFCVIPLKMKMTQGSSSTYFPSASSSFFFRHSPMILLDATAWPLPYGYLGVDMWCLMPYFAKNAVICLSMNCDPLSETNDCGQPKWQIMFFQTNNSTLASLMTNLFVYSSFATHRPTSRASYSALLFKAGKSSVMACSNKVSFGEVSSALELSLGLLTIFSFSADRVNSTTKSGKTWAFIAIASFAVNLGQGHILEAEVWGLYFGLKLAVEKGFTNLVIEMDATVVVSLVQQISSLQCHPLAALSYNLDLGICFFNETPVWVSSLLVDDLLGLARPRLMRSV